MNFLLNLQGVTVEQEPAPEVPTSTFSYFYCRDYSTYSVWVGCGD
ncbi:hypothetical protein ACIA5A_23415 [Micromonospora sp. NPDC051300]